MNILCGSAKPPQFGSCLAFVDGRGKKQRAQSSVAVIHTRQIALSENQMLKKGGSMSRILALLVLFLSVSMPSFAAEHTVTRSAKAVAHGSYKAGKDATHTTVKALKFIV
jgi:hypothetical protein